MAQGKKIGLPSLAFITFVCVVVLILLYSSIRSLFAEFAGEISVLNKQCSSLRHLSYIIASVHERLSAFLFIFSYFTLVRYPGKARSTRAKYCKSIRAYPSLCLF